MTIHVVGGVYGEYCVHPRWNEIFGSAGRAALAIANVETPVVLHSYMDEVTEQAYLDKRAWVKELNLAPTRVTRTVAFRYLHGLDVPRIDGIPDPKYPDIQINEEKVVRFGMLEGDAKVNAEWAVYDPQNVRQGKPFDSNGSTAKHLALVLNSWEAAFMAGIPGAHPSITAPALSQRQGAEVVVVKMGPEGAFVWTKSGSEQVPAYRTASVWKIGSGDCFVAHFANSWMHDGLHPIAAAQVASKATAYYCETQGFATRQVLADHLFNPVTLSTTYLSGSRRQVYLAGPFFDLSQVWQVEQARANLVDMGLKVFSPYHDIGLGSADDVVAKDLKAIVQSDIVFAIADGLDAGTIYEVGYARALGKPVVAYSERHYGSESLKMMEGSGCVMCSDYTTAVYSALWEAIKI